MKVIICFLLLSVTVPILGNSPSASDSKVIQSSTIPTTTPFHCNTRPPSPREVRSIPDSLPGPGPKDEVLIRNMVTGLVLEDATSKVIATGWTGKKSQRWILNYTNNNNKGHGLFTITNIGSKRNLNVQADMVNERESHLRHLWALNSDHTLSNYFTGLVLDLEDLGDGSDVVVKPRNSEKDSHQKFIIEVLGV